MRSLAYFGGGSGLLIRRSLVRAQVEEPGIHQRGLHRAVRPPRRFGLGIGPGRSA
jgi:hypothetical protein